MRNVILIWGIFFGLSVGALRAGSVVLLTGSEVNGTPNLGATSIRMEGLSSSEINFSDILEANFSDAPFHLDYFTSRSNPAAQLPASWRAQQIGPEELPGSFSYANGTFTLNGSGIHLGGKSDTLYFLGQPWSGNGQWTMRLVSIDTDSRTDAGLMVRDSWNPDSALIAEGMMDGNGQPPVGLSYFRRIQGDGVGNKQINVDLPSWFRLTKIGQSIVYSISNDGKEWSVLECYFDKMSTPDAWAGLYVDNHREKDKNPKLAKAVFDQVTFAPPPSSAQMLPPGVLLRSGTFLAGHFNGLDFNPANPDGPGSFNRSGENVSIVPSKIALVAFHPLPRAQIAGMGSQVGLLMSNGDFLSGDVESLNENGVRVSSLLLGITTYSTSQAGACILNPMQPQPANYEVRLVDGSSVLANGVNLAGGQFVIEEVSGITVNVAAKDVAQFRAGPAVAQSLIELPWKATPLPAAPANPAPAVKPATANPPPATNGAPLAIAALAANPAAAAAPPIADPAPLVQCWEGNNQEQIMAVAAETAVDFPMNDKFRSLALRIGLSPDAPLNGQAIIVILADGREVGRTPPFNATDQPRFVQITLQGPKTVTFVAHTNFPGTKVLFIDPVAIR